MNDQNRDRTSDTQEEGLFPEEPAVKRENPYLRKNRQKTPPPEKKPPERSSGPSDFPSPSDTESDAPTGRRRSSGFFFEHVKLITTILTALAILSLVIITDVVGWVRDAGERYEQADKTPLTLKHIEGLTKKTDPITWSDLSRFRRYNASDAENSITWFFKVEGTSYEVWISGTATDKPPTYVYLYDMTSDAMLDLNDGDLDDFLNPVDPNWKNETDTASESATAPAADAETDTTPETDSDTASDTE